MRPLLGRLPDCAGDPAPRLLLSAMPFAVAEAGAMGMRWLVPQGDLDAGGGVVADRAVSATGLVRRAITRTDGLHGAIWARGVQVCPVRWPESRFPG